MCSFAESYFQSVYSRFGSISGCRSKVFLSPALAERIEHRAYNGNPHALVRHYEFNENSLDN